jgi:hypothetical protein
MHTDTIMDTDGQRTQVGPDPLDYVLRYSPADYDCYCQGRYIGSRATLPKAVEAVEYEQAKAARHPQPYLLRTARSPHTRRRCAPSQHACTTSRRGWPPSRRACADARTAHDGAYSRFHSAPELLDAERSLGLAVHTTENDHAVRHGCLIWGR